MWIEPGSRHDPCARPTASWAWRQPPLQVIVPLAPPTGVTFACGLPFQKRNAPRSRSPGSRSIGARTKDAWSTGAGWGVAGMRRAAVVHRGTRAGRDHAWGWPRIAPRGCSDRGQPGGHSAPRMAGTCRAALRPGRFVDVGILEPRRIGRSAARIPPFLRRLSCAPIPFHRSRRTALNRSDLRHRVLRDGAGPRSAHRSRGACPNQLVADPVWTGLSARIHGSAPDRSGRDIIMRVVARRRLQDG